MLFGAATAYYPKPGGSGRLSGHPADPEQAVRLLFEVRESFVLPDGELEFQIAYDGKTRRKFADLKARLAPQGYRPELTGTPEECVLTVRKVVPTPKRPPRLPVLMALLAAAALAVSALLQQGVYTELVPSWPLYLTLFAFGVAVAALLGAHELAQRLMARARDAGHASSYLIPGIPFIPPFTPALGFVSYQREPALNRDSLFDTVVAGPFAMLGLAVLLYAVGIVTAVPSAVPFAGTNLANTTVSINPSAIQFGLAEVLGPLARPVPAGHLPVSPLADGAYVGFILVFFALLPMASYDGGIMASAAWGQKGARIASYLSILALLVLDTWTYLPVAVVVLILVGRPNQLKLLDEVTPLSKPRQWLLLGTIVLAFLCLPLPSNIATFPLP
jgi:hypothetical protein